MKKRHAKKIRERIDIIGLRNGRKSVTALVKLCSNLANFAMKSFTCSFSKNRVAFASILKRKSIRLADRGASGDLHGYVIPCFSDHEMQILTKTITYGHSEMNGAVQPHRLRSPLHPWNRHRMRIGNPSCIYRDHSRRSVDYLLNVPLCSNAMRHTEMNSLSHGNSYEEK